MARVFTDAGAMKLISAAQRLTSDPSFSVSFWIRRTATPAASRGLIAAGDPVAAVGFGIRLLLTTNLIQAHFPYSTTDKIRSSSTAPALNTWVHVLVAHNNTGLNSTDFTFYFDGKSEAGTSVSNGVGTHDTATAAPIEIGANTASGETAPPAAIGPIAFWSRALSAAEALALATGKHPTAIPEGLIEYFEMEGATNEEGALQKLFLVQGATNPTNTVVNPAIEKPVARRPGRVRSRFIVPTASVLRVRRTLHPFGNHAGGRAMR